MVWFSCLAYFSAVVDEDVGKTSPSGFREEPSNIFLDDVSTAALDDVVRRDDFELVLLAFSKSH